MKKIILILGGISVILVFVIFILYKNYYSSNEEVVDIFKDTDESNEEKEEDIEDKEDSLLKVTVDIKGMVQNPGVYEVDDSTRVNDVIMLAGGLLDGADTSLINLAKVVEDEMTIIIYSKEEIESKYKEEQCICDCPLISNDACIDEVKNEDDSRNKENRLININTCTKEDIMTVNGIGEAKAKAIIEYREKNGKFSSVEDIKNVSGIGDALFEKIKAYITV